jgi:hypothetical protein
MSGDAAARQPGCASRDGRPACVPVEPWENRLDLAPESSDAEEQGPAKGREEAA